MLQELIKIWVWQVRYYSKSPWSFSLTSSYNNWLLCNFTRSAHDRGIIYLLAWETYFRLLFFVFENEQDIYRHDVISFVFLSTNYVRLFFGERKLERRLSHSLVIYQSRQLISVPMCLSLGRWWNGAFFCWRSRTNC